MVVIYLCGENKLDMSICPQKGVINIFTLEGLYEKKTAFYCEYLKGLLIIPLDFITWLKGSLRRNQFSSAGSIH